MLQPTTDRRLLLPLLVALIALAWLALWLWGQSPFARYLSHHSLEAVRGSALLMLVFTTGWALMIVAMMLPTSLPLVLLFDAVVRQRPERPRLITVLISGYLVVWVLFGGLIYLGDAILHEVIERAAWLEANTWALSAGTLALAGVYQFTPLKYICLDKCRSPFSFIVEHWRGPKPTGQAFRLGVHHGLFCLGCCWTLMLLMFAVGVGNLGWMLVLGALMALEKNVPWGRKLSAPLGTVLIAWGVALAVGIAPVW
jgi:predicted metal-binding membrane protein